MGNVSKKERMRFLSFWPAVLTVFSVITGSGMTAFAADQDIVVLYINDVHCGLDDNIGYTGIDTSIPSSMQLDDKGNFLTVILH